MTAFSEKIEIRHLINSGDYFDAYRATDISLDRPVFLKVAKASNGSVAPMVVGAHVRMWQALARLRVDGMPAILDIGSNHGRQYLVTEWITGTSLRALVDAGPAVFTQPAELLVAILRQGLAILADLHGQGFVHGDIGPGNILIGTRSGNLKVHMVDPFPAEDLRDPADPNSRLIFGTPSFMAPEIRGGGPASIQADLFALGKVIAEAARRLNTGAPVLVETLIAERPKDRPASAEQASLALASAFAPRTKPDEFRALGGDARPSDRAARTDWHARTGADQPANASVPPSRAPATTPSNTWSEASTVVSAIDAPRSDWTEASAAVSVPVPPARDAPAVPADFSIMAPSSIRAGRNFVVEVWVAPSGQRSAMIEQATRSGRMIERGSRSHIDLKRDTIISVMLRLPDFEVPEPVETLGWNGDIRNVGFIVKAPSALAPGLYPGAVKLMQGQIPFASIAFDLEIAGNELTAESSRPLNARVQRIAQAFASYASDDRPEVLRRVQGIQAVGTKVFLDIVNLRSGEEWERALYREIEGSDSLFLFWSRNAARSKWVEREWQYALERRGIDFINPLALEDPRLVQPPDELAGKHFNDMLLAFIAAEEAYRRSQ